MLVVVDLRDNSYNGYYCDDDFSFSIMSVALNVPVPVNEVVVRLAAFLALCPVLVKAPEEEPTLVDEDTAVDFLLDISVPILLLLLVVAFLLLALLLLLLSLVVLVLVLILVLP